MKSLWLCGVFSCLLVANVWAAPRYDAEVSVDIMAETVTEAKAKAMAKAARDGLSEVVLSISTAKSVADINKLTDAQIQHFISGVTVLMEKSSNVRYIADLRVDINEEILKAYMAENDMPLVVGEEQDVLAVPLFEDAEGVVDLWGDGNVWRQAFNERRQVRKGNLNIYSIEKNLGNITAVEAGRIYDMTDEEYNEMAAFNRVQAIYVLKFSLKDGKVFVKSFPGREESEIEIGDASPIEMVDKVLPLFKDIKKTDAGDEAVAVNERFEVVYTYPKLGAWLSLQRLLNDNPQVQNIKIVSIINNKVHFNFDFNGVIEKLAAHLDINGYKLRREGEHYVIY